MIWSSDAAGTLLYMGEEWDAFTGLEAITVFDVGWKSAAHHDDRRQVDVFFAEALIRQSEFCITFRLRLASGAYAWVRAGAVPSVSIPDHEFIGYLGTITEMNDQTVMPDAVCAEFGSSRVMAYEPETEAHSAMELIADHVLLSHSFAVKVGHQPVREALETSLIAVGRALAQGALAVA